MYVTKEEITRAKEIDLLTYLREYEPDNLVSLGGDTYSTKTHDSVKISRGLWCQWSSGIGGRSALDYLVKVDHISLPEAVTRINSRAPVPPAHAVPSPAAKTQQGFLLPKKHTDCNRVLRYLMGRGIDKTVLDFCIKGGRLYEEAGRHNCVFVGADTKGTPRYATKRSTQDKRFFLDVDGSDKRYSFCLSAQCESSTLHLFECAIDALSYATLCAMKGKDWQRLHLLSLSGVYAPRKTGEITLPLALEQYLKDRPNIKSIALHLDNDKAGRAAASAIVQLLQEQYAVRDSPPPTEKDVNAYLLHCLAKSPAEKEKVDAR